MQHLEKQYCKDGLFLNHICTRTFALKMGMICTGAFRSQDFSIYEILRTIKNHNWILPKSHSHCLPMQSHHHGIATAADAAPYMEVTTPL